MSKELAFTDDNDVVKYLDTTTAFNLALTADGVAFDLTNAKSVLVKIANDDGYIMQQTIDLATVTSPLGGTLSFPINQDIMNTLVPDDYDIEVWVTMNDGTQAIFPSDGTLGFSIEENLMSDTGEVIPVITFDQFNDQFDDMMAQMQNTVSNVKKGDKGDTGSGLEIKDKVSSVSNLPSTANEGDGYLVGEELYVRVNNAWKDCGLLQGPKGDQGPQGIQGNTGTGISSTTIQYQISSSATTAPTGIWSNNIVATTTTNPYLWMKATLNYTDKTTKDFYLVSQKGDKGDTGATGPQGPTGPRGPVGSGLVVKGTVTDASQLPKIGNQEGYCYFIGKDLYVWDAGAWKNCGSVSPDLSKYVTITDLNNGLSTKVTDNKDGTEQLNGVQVQPFNKLSDTIGGRNLYLNSKIIIDGYGINGSGNVTVEPFDSATNMWHIVAKQGIGDNLGLYLIDYGNGKLPNNSNWSYSADVKGTGNISNFGIEASNKNPVVGTVGSEWSRISQTGWFVNSEIKTIIMYFDTTSSPVDAYIKLPKLEIGSVPTDWTPAPEDKVNVSDMRKPASDVAGIEEVNAKQDKIGYTPADDSKVVHDTGTEEIAGQKTFDIAPIDKKTGNPYITKDGVPAVSSTIADTTKDANFTGKLQKSGIDVATTTDVTNTVNTATNKVVTTDKLANFTAGLQKGGIDVATAADLKSVEKSAWHQLDKSHIMMGNAYYSDCLYRIDPVTKRIYIHCIVDAETDSSMNAHLDFSSVVSKFTSKGAGTMEYARYSTAGSCVFSISGSKISFTTPQIENIELIIASVPLENCWFGYDTLLI